jgi:triacylglycerol lipase
MCFRIHLKYPLIMVHGAGFRDRTAGVNYWGRIPKYLARAGVRVFYGDTDAWGSIESNALQLRRTVLSVLAKTGAEKVNIIAHSKGGLEARRLVNAWDMASRVASLTTISTPHRGVKAMNLAFQLPKRLYRFVSFCMDLWFMILGDLNPDFYTSSLELSAKRCAEFNRRNPDCGAVYCQSYAGKLRFFFGDVLYLFTWVLVKLYDGDNDGLCPVESAKWGSFRGIVTTRGALGISHGGILDLYRIPYKGVKIPELYGAIVRDLAERGF